MLKVHIDDGRTLQFDFSDGNQLAKWLDLAKSHHFQEKITGLTVIKQGVSYSVPRPKDHKRIAFFAEHIEINNKANKDAEKIVCQAGDTSVILTAYGSQRSARIDVARPGFQRYNSLQDRSK